MKPNKRVYHCQSVLANHITEYISLKQSIGFKYHSPAENLYRFDKFCVNEKLTEIRLDSDIIEKWIAPRKSESPNTRVARISALKGFAEYLTNLNIPVERPSVKGYTTNQWQYTPYIFTHDEIKDFIKNADSLEKPARNSMFHIIFPALIRTIYGCGMRVSEALSLRIKDVDLQSGTLIIQNSKFGRSRLLPISSSLKNFLADYIPKIHHYPLDSDFLFPNSSGEQYSQRTVYDKFRIVLWQSGISHGGRGKGPRVHDFRHTFAVHSLQKCINDGVDTYAFLPVLAAYLGHSKITTTEMYLRLTSEIYPDILRKSESISHIAIPEVQDYED